MKKDVNLVAIDAAYNERTGLNIKGDLSSDTAYSVNEFSNMYAAWLEVCQDTLDELVKLRVSNKDQWLVTINDAGYATNLILDLVEMTCWIPYKGKEVDMKNVAYNSFIVCPDNQYLAKFFI